MKIKSSLKVIIGSAIFACVVGGVGTYAWYSKTAYIKNGENPFDGSVQDEYYASGSGTQDDPYIINKPRHLYNLAWLQYLGFYNKGDGSSEDHQYYFKLGNNIDMSEFGPIPPIGSELNPFIGNFNGDGFAISNATISNDFSDYRAHPSVINGWNSTNYKQPHILGLFGIIGDYTGCNKSTVVDSQVNEFKNTALTGLTVKSGVQDSLMGIAAGYVNDINLEDSHDVLKNVVVDNSGIDVGSSAAQAYAGGPTSNISDYTLVGYTNNSASVIKASKSVYGVNFDTDINYVASSQGEEIGFGGSIGVDELYKRLETFRNSSKNTQDHVQNSEIHYFDNGVEDISKSRTTTTEFESYEYYDEDNDLQGRVVFGQTQGNYLWGKRTHSYTYTTTKEYHTDEDETCYYVLSNGYYLRFTGGNAAGTTNEAQKTLLFVDNDGWVYYKYGNNNTIYYLYANSATDGTLRSSTSKQNYMFKISGTTFGLYMRQTNEYSRYVQYNSKSFRINGNSTNFTQTTQNGETCYYVLSSGYYLRFTGGNAAGTTNEAQKTLLFVDNDGWVYYKYNNAIYYLYASATNNATLRSSTSKQNYMFKISGTTFRLYQNDVCNRYVQYNSSSFRVNGSSTNFTQTTDFETEVETETLSYTTNGTYLPLNVYKDESEITDAVREKLPGEKLVVNGAKLNNTGYIIGGTKDMNDQWGSAVRIDRKSTSGLNRALGGANTYNNTGNNLQILTRTKDSNGVTFINDNYNNGVDLSNELKNLSYDTDETKHDVSDLGLNVYNNARDNLHKQLIANGNDLYVLRFNEFQINKNSTITAEKVLLNGEIKTNYVFPESCIDFNLSQKGYISFFGSGYRGGNPCNAFFSLFHLVRKSDGSIDTLKRMTNIYGTNNKKDPYIYKYEDNTYSIYDRDTKQYVQTSLPSNYVEHFNMTWVEQPGFTQIDNTLWYFEIPVNEGEYALGAVNGGTGGYMMYLDVGTNAAETNRTVLYEKYSITESKCNYPVGVSLVSLDTSFASGTKAIIPETAIDSSNSACMVIKATVTGVYSMDRNNDDELILSRNNPALAPPIYADDTIESIHEKDSSTQVNIEAASARDNIVKKMEFYDYDVSTNSLIITSITDSYLNDGSTFDNRTISQKTYVGNEPTAEPSTSYVYDAETDERSYMKIYNHLNSGQSFTADEMIDNETLVIDSTKLNDTCIMSYKLKSSTGNSYEEEDVVNVVLDTNFDNGSFYRFDNFEITITPDAGSMTIQILSFESSFTSVVYDYADDLSNSESIQVVLTINGTTITGVTMLTATAS